MATVEKSISIASVAVVAIVGILVLAGYVGILETPYRIGFGAAILAYAALRLFMIFRPGRDERERP